MAGARHGGLTAGTGWMFLSAALFGYFGFFIGLKATTADGTVVWFFALLLWTLRLAAIGFLLSAVFSLTAPLVGEGLYAVIGLASAAAFVTIGVADVLDTQRMAALPPLLAFFFAAWNGLASFSGLRMVVARTRSRRDDGAVFGEP